MIPAETWYKTHNRELLAIIQAFKIWCHYLEGYKYAIIILINHNKIQQFMHTKNLSAGQVRST